MQYEGYNFALVMPKHAYGAARVVGREGVCVLVSLYGVRMTTLSRTRSNHGASTARTGPYAIR